MAKMKNFGNWIKENKKPLTLGVLGGVAAWAGAEYLTLPPYARHLGFYPAVVAGFGKAFDESYSRSKGRPTTTAEKMWNYTKGGLLAAGVIESWENLGTAVEIVRNNLEFIDVAAQNVKPGINAIKDTFPGIGYESFDDAAITTATGTGMGAVLGLKDYVRSTKRC